MRNRVAKSIFSAFSASALIGGAIVSYYLFNTTAQIKERKTEINNQVLIDSLRREINRSFQIPGDEWPSEVFVGDNTYRVRYTLDRDLTDYIQRLLRHFRSDFSSVVVMDNNTGAILAAVGHDRQTNEFNKILPFSSTHPSASLIKIVATADLLERGKVDGATTFRHRGRGTTLFRSQLEATNVGRAVDFASAFAFSNNVVFGQAAIQKSSGPKLYQMAREFGFNRRLMQDLDLSESRFTVADSSFHLAELASGFNRETMISPVHAALLSSVVANNGLIASPYMVDKVFSPEGEIVWGLYPRFSRILGLDAVDELKLMMEKTITTGTARRDFSTMRHGLRPQLEIGGKTGSITGGIPFGRRDWFSVYAIPKDERFGRGISVAVMNINLDKWYVRSTHLSKRVIEYYYNNIYPLDERNTIALPKTVALQEGYDKTEL